MKVHVDSTEVFVQTVGALEQKKRGRAAALTVTYDLAVDDGAGDCDVGALQGVVLDTVCLHACDAQTYVRALCVPATIGTLVVDVSRVFDESGDIHLDSTILRGAMETLGRVRAHRLICTSDDLACALRVAEMLRTAPCRSFGVLAVSDGVREWDM